MTIARAGKSQPVRVARVYKGTCGICYQPVVTGQAYEYGGGTNTKNQCLFHYNCHKPTSAPTWEELQKTNSPR